MVLTSIVKIFLKFWNILFKLFKKTKPSGVIWSSLSKETGVNASTEINKQMATNYITFIHWEVTEKI